jgi:hypothetical protein
VTRVTGARDHWVYPPLKPEPLVEAWRLGTAVYLLWAKHGAYTRVTESGSDVVYTLPRNAERLAGAGS